ncbi:unnamed protein product [Musa acuminata subsp. burmannicoides]
MARVPSRVAIFGATPDRRSNECITIEYSCTVLHVKSCSLYAYNMRRSTVHRKNNISLLMCSKVERERERGKVPGFARREGGRATAGCQTRGAISSLRSCGNMVQNLAVAHDGSVGNEKQAKGKLG